MIKQIFKTFQYDKFFSFVDHIGNELNERKLRFDKSDLIEQAIAYFSDNQLIWVDKKGYDHVDLNGNRYEAKSQQKCLYTATGNRKKESTAKIKLANTLQRGQNKQLNKTAEHLLIVDTGGPLQYSMATCSFETAMKYSKELPDGFECQIPMSELTFFCHPEDVVIRPNMDIKSYRDIKREIQRDYINAFMQEA